LRAYRLRFTHAGALVYQCEFWAADARDAHFIASTMRHTSAITYDCAELWGDTLLIAWKRADKTASSLAEQRQDQIIDKEIALANSAWALNATRALLQRPPAESVDPQA
jgi:hypothetical protein